MGKIIKIFFNINKDNKSYFSDAITIIDGKMDIAEIFHMQRIMFTMEKLPEEAGEDTLTTLEIVDLDDITHTEIYMLDSADYSEERNAIILHFKNKSYDKHYPERIIVIADTEGLTHFLYDLVVRGQIWEEDIREE